MDLDKSSVPRVSPAGDSTEARLGDVREPIAIRAHLVLCLQGFRGEGYSPSFVAAMASLHRTLAEDPDQRVRLLDQPGTICRACTHLHLGGCTLGGPDHEPHMKAQDNDVLQRLGLAPGAVYPWSLVRSRIAAAIEAPDLPEICTTCPWLSLGYCAEGLERLRAAGCAAPGGETDQEPSAQPTAHG